METIPAETVTQVIEVVEQIDYTGYVTGILEFTAMSADYLQIICGIMVFFMVCVLCYFAYKFFRIFF